ncbi:hypothetical protein GCM10011506_06130 [Marivirga lumbricoides]|uniref:Uncharacterized protein n=1 Tax=Marivirga lumbricoides TaxID=1046115 RepID=A0ABQ1LE94_9BACT|nr:hypothetical protein GCM10011506_06130 [Marivirga lumbricoides]
MRAKKQMQVMLALFLIVVASHHKLFSQDIIVLNNGEKISSKVIVIGISDITYKKFENLEGPDYVIAKDDVLKITYEDGRDEFFLQKSPSASNKRPASSVEPGLNLAYKGTLDADFNYNKKWPFWTTFGGTIIFLPVGLAAGLISGIVTPNIAVLIPEKELLENPVYYDAYMKKAKLKKWGRVGRGLVFGVAFNVAVFIILSSSYN